MGTDKYTTPKAAPSLFELAAQGYEIIEEDLPEKCAMAIVHAWKVVFIQRKNTAPADALACYNPAQTKGVHEDEEQRATDAVFDLAA